MKAKGITGKGCYKEYFGVPRWFARSFGIDGNGSLLNAACCRHYLGFGFNKETKTWGCGVFLTDYELGLSFWETQAAEADFIIHFKEEEV
jgi:hypothetical protein